MFITNPLTPAELLAELLMLDSVKDEKTARFQTMGHNDDLCPAFQRQIDFMLRSYIQLRNDVHDIQGMRDNGTDVMLRYQVDDEGPFRVGLQIKSYREIEDWKEKKVHRGIPGKAALILKKK